MNAIDLQDYEENVKKKNVIMNSDIVITITSSLPDAQTINTSKKFKEMSFTILFKEGASHYKADAGEYTHQVEVT